MLVVSSISTHHFSLVAGKLLLTNGKDESCNVSIDLSASPSVDIQNLALSSFLNKCLRNDGAVNHVLVIN